MEDKLMECLRNDVDHFLKTEYCCMPYWHERHRRLLHLIYNDNPREFTNWDVIHGTMFQDADQMEYEYLTQSIDWNTLKYLLKEDEIGKPAEYTCMPESSGNLIHHLYSFMRLKEITTLNLSECKKVFEFGGGYGSFCRLLHRIGFKEDYYIFDLPIFSCLQKYFLSHIDINVLMKYNDTHIGYSNVQRGNVLLINDINYLKKNEDEILCGLDLFITLWSLSEAPINLRNYFFNSLINPKFFLIAYQGKFAEIDNKMYFKDLIDKKNNYFWHNEEIAHMEDQYYLIGSRNDLQR